MYTIDDFPMMTPMKYYNNEDTSNAKRQAMIDNKDGEYIATKKNDGDWAMLIHWEKGKNLVRSRSISKVTGVYGDYTEKVPHIVEEMDRNWPDNTVVLAELCWDQDGTNANTVGTILRCLPAKAVERQKENKLKAVIFDLLMVDGKDLTNLGYYFRLEEVLLFPRGLYTYPTEVVTQDFAAAADQIIAGGGEGIVIQRCDYTYNPGNRTAWKTLKLKQQLPEMELKVVGVLEPNMLYEGDCPETWEYKMMICTSNHSTTGSIIGTEMLVTKPYYFGWKNGITVELPDGTTCDVASGLTDDDREWLATEAAQQMIDNEELYAVVKAMSFNDKGRLRHPSLVRLRNEVN
jgi:ATP-dependent DNA ligase